MHFTALQPENLKNVCCYMYAGIERINDIYFYEQFFSLAQCKKKMWTRGFKLISVN